MRQWAAWDPVLRHADELEPEIYPLGFDIEEVRALSEIFSELNPQSEHV